MPEGLIIKIVNDATDALTLDRIHSDVDTVTYITRQRLRDMLTQLNHDGNVKREKYSIKHPDAPFMNVVVAEIYYATEKQKEKFETETLPRLEREKRQSIV